jgi:peptidoglycan-N-acetylglucosamine deacetylase
MKILSVDVEDWFHLLDHESTSAIEGWGRYDSRIQESIDLILSELARRSTKATFFCLGWVAEAHPELVRRIDAAGHEIGTHSYAHQLVSRQSPVAFEHDLVRSIRAIQSVTGKRVRAYRAPGFSIGRKQAWAFDLLVRHGISVDCSVFLGSHAHGGDSAFCDGPSIIQTSTGCVKEFPVKMGSVLGKKLAFSGGGYFRMLPYALVREQLKHADYAMAYFHPRDFDVHQPVVRGLGPLRRFKSYVGLSGSLAKFRRMLDEFEFLDIDQALKIMDWAQAPIVTTR